MRGKVTRDSSIAVVTHELFYGAAQALRDYLNTIPVATLTFVSHSINRQNPYSYAQIFNRGKLQKKKIHTLIRLPLIVEYIVHEVITSLWILQTKRKYDVYVGVNPLNCLVGIIYRKIGLTKHVIFYAIDFTPKRFGNVLLNNLYHRLEKFCVYYADECWNVSPRIEEGRKKFLGLSNKRIYQKVVPIGVWQRDIVKPNKERKEKSSIIFVGHILKKQGIQKVINALPLVAKKIKDVTFTIVGDGEYLPDLKKLVKQIHMTKHVVFHGLEHNQEIIKSLLRESSIAIACYDPTGEGDSNFTYYADPTKIKTYLASGLPVILTSISYNADEINNKKCGIVVDYDERSIAKTITELLTNSVELQSYRKNAYSYIKASTWEHIFKTAFSSL